MDKFLKDLLKEKNKNNSLSIDEVLGKNTEKDSLCDGSLSFNPLVGLKVGECQEVWNFSCIFTEILSLVEQTISWLGQTNSSISCHGRYNQHFFEYALSSESKKHAKE